MRLDNPFLAKRRCFRDGNVQLLFIEKENLVQSAVSVTLLNVSVAILAGFAIFSGRFSFGLSPDAGPMLLFNVLPSVFHKMPLGIIFFIGVSALIFICYTDVCIFNA